MGGPETVGPLALLLFAAGCTCSHEAPTPTPPTDDGLVEASVAWPEPVLEDLAERPPATRVTVTPAQVEVDNELLVGTWPAGSVDRARTEGDPEHPRWPLLRVAVSSPEDPALRAALDPAAALVGGSDAYRRAKP